MQHFHLDPVGGLAGDMFVAVLLDLRPALADVALAAVRAAGLAADVELAHRPYADGIVSGSRYAVSRRDEQPAAHTHHHHHHGPHVHWAALRARLAAAPLAAGVRERAIAIFARLADAEARVHGVDADAVAFHEVGAWDSIADIVAASALLEALGPATWSVGPIPLGSGRVRRARFAAGAGARDRAAARGLCLFRRRPAGRAGHADRRAILAHLAPTQGLGTTPRRLRQSGYGFGTRRFEGLSNVLRVLAFDHLAPAPHRDEVLEIRFEIDDQTAEDLALGLERLRALDGVLDVGQFPITGKRGRLASAIQVLARPEAEATVTAACFTETTTLGLRLQRLERQVLAAARCTAWAARA